MSTVTTKVSRRRRRKWRIRKKVFGTPERPRLTVYRSLKHIYAQIIDDTQGRTLLAASTVSPALRGELSCGGNKAAAATVGQVLASQALAKGITTVVFDRNGYKFHGRVKALAEAAREAGLKF